MKIIILPTYNERNNLAELLALIYNQVEDIHVLVVDDNSPDGTGELVRELMQQYNDRLFLLARPGKLGLGTAYIAGFKWALARDYQYIFEMDADFSHNPRYLTTFMTEAETADLVLGSRYIAGGGVTNWNMFRRLISRGGNVYARLILGLPFKDVTGGYKCFRREVLEQIELEDVKSNGYSFQIELTYRAFLKAYSIKEVPIIFEERAAGQSKMSKEIFREAIIMVWKLRAAKNRLKAAPFKEIHSAGTSLAQP
ncbi:polyprenol monophosphomannose synthase [Sporomusa malonica]|uniref:Dolichol-phosphate mannosyltransferase n=1 Tax=Sporomusa malonica TaxID=112901 RepID=A0A1W2DQ11_9FIRM|nr:polyprenol monophosphomannose synthase [Sporomusa malonica]SMC99625.1 dolichol-phosphate mannosyltransferase [Sporomusa malonica]